MTAMTAPLQWSDLTIRLFLTVLAGILIGSNRSEHGKAAGMRTTLMVCLAASVAMLQVNALLAMSGRRPDSFVMNDLMRLPLGILTGVGFIGGGAILRRDNIVVGVTTAATLWLVTVIGLCFGGGQLVLGAVATILGLLALSVLKWAEDSLRCERRSRLAIEIDATGPVDAEIRRRLGDSELAILESQQIGDAITGRRRLVYHLREFRRPNDTAPPDVVHELEQQTGVVRIEWRGGS